MSPEKKDTRIRIAAPAHPCARGISASMRVILAQKLRLLRFIRGWSQEVLAEFVGLHRTYVSSIAPLLRFPAPAVLVLP